MFNQDTKTVIPMGSELFLIYHDAAYLPSSNFHVHDYYELTILLSAKMECRFEDQTLMLHAGDILLLRPGEIHRKIPFEGAKHFNIAIVPDVIHECLRFLTGSPNHPALMGGAHLPAKTPDAAEFKHISSALERLMEDISANTDNLYIRLRALAASVISLYLIEEEKSLLPYDAPDWIAEAVAAFRSPANLSRGVAFFEELPVSHTHLCRLFKKYLNMTVIQYVNETRLSYAANALLHSDTPILEICADVGYASLSHFYSLFKKRYQVAPMEYRALGIDARARLFRTTRVQVVEDTADQP